MRQTGSEWQDYRGVHEMPQLQPLTLENVQDVERLARGGLTVLQIAGQLALPRGLVRQHLELAGLMKAGSYNTHRASRTHRVYRRRA